MALDVKHTTQAGGVDSGDGKISKNAWNESHTLTAADGKLLGASGSTTVGEITVGSGLSLSAGTLSVNFTGYLTTAAAASTYAPIASPTFTGKVQLPSPSGTAAGVNLGSGTNSGPVEGDLWYSSSALTLRGGSQSLNVAFTNAAQNFTAKITTAASASGASGFRVQHGAAPTSPQDGDLWSTTSGWYVRTNGATQQLSIVGHTHAQSDITDLTSDLAAKAPLASPALTGTPTAPTADAATNTTQIATTAFVQTVTAYWAGLKADVASPTFTGKVTTAASATGGAGFNLPHGAAPTSPVNGDFWTTTGGLYARVDGATYTLASLEGANTFNAFQTFTADIKSYRPGENSGNAGVVYLNSAATRYLYWDGTSYNLPGGPVVAAGTNLNNAIADKANSANASFTGTWIFSSAAPTMNLSDTDWGSRYIHANGGLIGFLTSAQAWAMYVDNSGNGSFAGSVAGTSGSFSSSVSASSFSTAGSISAGFGGISVVSTGPTGFDVDSSAQTAIGLYAKCSHATANGYGILSQFSRAAHADYEFFRGRSNAAGTLDNEFRMSGTGGFFSDIAATTPADYAEMFEWSDGNPDDEDRRGLTVVLDGTKVRKATSADPAHAIIGVVSGSPAIIADAGWARWDGRYLRDDYGAYILTPDGYRTENPNYDPTVEYVPRMERKEWDAIGLVGKLRVRAGQPVGDRWLKMRDFSPTIEEWLVR